MRLWGRTHRWVPDAKFALQVALEIVGQFPWRKLVLFGHAAINSSERCEGSYQRGCVLHRTLAPRSAQYTLVTLEQRDADTETASGAKGNRINDTTERERIKVADDPRSPRCGGAPRLSVRAHGADGERQCSNGATGADETMHALGEGRRGA